MDEVARPWSPLSVNEVVTLLKDAPFRWWIAGGYALELFAGHAWREHTDIDILVLRPDLPLLPLHLQDWTLWLADPPGSLRPWARDELPAATVHDIWVRKPASACWQFQTMVDEAKGNMWVSRRHADITLPVEALGARTANGTPFLAPEVQLFYKGRSIREKDEHDFGMINPPLDERQRTWLSSVIRQCYGGDHAWLEQLNCKL